MAEIPSTIVEKAAHNLTWTTFLHFQKKKMEEKDQDISAEIYDVLSSGGVVGIAFDIETTGGDMEKNALVELGAVAIDVSKTDKPVTVLARFEGRMKIPEGRGFEEQCEKEFWDVQKPGEKQRVLACKTEPEDVMHAFVKWAFDVKEFHAGPPGAKQHVRFMSDAAFFDAAWVSMYLAKYANHYPLHTFFSTPTQSCFRPVLDTNAFYRGVAGKTLIDELEAECGEDGWFSAEKALKKSLRIPETDTIDVEHDHRAVNDAESIAKKYARAVRYLVSDKQPSQAPGDINFQISTAVNLMPHDCIIYAQDKTTVLHTIPATGKVLRLIPNTSPLPAVSANVGGDSFPIVVGAPSYDGLSDGVPDAPIIVSDIVARYLMDETEVTHPVFVPDTNPGCVVRNSEGSIVGTTTLRLYSC